MTTDELLNVTRSGVAGLPAWVAGLLTALAVALLVLSAMRLRRWGRRSTATKITGLATVLGLGWSGQGMYHVATTQYEMAREVAGVLFFVFETWLVGRMLRAYEYREDRRRRARFVQAVWTGAVVMAVVVAVGEGWSQAPGRLAVPLLVTYGWYTDLIADDDPSEVVDTERRWTARELGLRVGWLKVRDADVADRTRAESRYLVQRMARIEFGLQFGARWVSVVLRRRTRLAKLRLQADGVMLAEVAERIARARGEAPAEPARTPSPEPAAPAPAVDVAPAPRREPRSRPSGHPSGTVVRMVHGRPLAGDDLREDFIARVLASMTPERPRGATTTQVRGAYDPPIGQRVADSWAAEARRRAAGRANGRPLVDHVS